VSPLSVSDVLANRNETVRNAAEIIGRSKNRRAVFEAIYKGQKPVKTVAELMTATGIDERGVLTLAKELDDHELIERVRLAGRYVYRKVPSIVPIRDRILRLATDKKAREALPTKAHPRTTVVRSVSVSSKRIDIEQVTVDDVANFSRVRLVDVGTVDPVVPEALFKAGVKRMLGELAPFPDWGGERNDLYTTRAVLGGKRRAAAFAFKGPAATGKLTPGKMGKNGDQIDRLFQSPADVFFVQFCRDIDEAIVTQMEKGATIKSLATGKRVYYGIIDGEDSSRLMTAYKAIFKVRPPKP
jgi:hypothetical protein